MGCTSSEHKNPPFSVSDLCKDNGIVNFQTKLISKKGRGFTH